MSIQIEHASVDGVYHIESDVYEDNRGWISEVYVADSFLEAGIRTTFCLDLVSKSAKNTLRGLHFQTEPYQQAKLVRCISGKIFDVAVDLRPDSDTRGEYVSVYLSAGKGNALYIPRGFAHGFLTVEENSKVLYKLDKRYAPEYETGIHWEDPVIDIDWPIKGGPILSESDRKLPSVQESEVIKWAPRD